MEEKVAGKNAIKEAYPVMVVPGLLFQGQGYYKNHIHG